MKSTFLVGRFLPAYGSKFGRLPDRKMVSEGLSSDQLARRFAERSALYRSRRLEYLVMGQIGAILALSMTIGAFRMDITANETLEYVMPDQETVQMEDILQTQQLEKPPPPPRPPVPVVVPDDMVLEDDDLDLDVFLDMDEAVTDLPPPPPEPVEVEEEEIFVIVEKMPEIIGGLQRLYTYVQYPVIAQKAEIEGTVHVRIVVTPEGKPSQPEIIRSVHELLDKAALEGIMQLEFEPALQRARAVSVYMMIPVKFDLR